MVPEMFVNRVSVNPRGDGRLAGRKANAAFVLTAVSIPEIVLFVGTGTAPFESVHTILRAAFRRDTAGYNSLKDFGTPWCRISFRSYSRQYE